MILGSEFGNVFRPAGHEEIQYIQYISPRTTIHDYFFGVGWNMRSGTRSADPQDQGARPGDPFPNLSSQGGACFEVRMPLDSLETGINPRSCKSTIAGPEKKIIDVYDVWSVLSYLILPHLNLL